METIKLETRIAAPAMRVFLLSLSIDLHVESASRTREQAIAGVKHGLIGPGESVTWRGRHFGLWLRHTTRITRYEPPHLFEDVMTHGLFKSFHHRHTFRTEDDATVMQDELRFAAPLGMLGLAAEKLALRKHLTLFLKERNAVIQRVAESPHWTRYVPDHLAKWSERR